MAARDWFRRSRRVPTIFLGVAVVSAVALGGLAWLILDQDRDLEDKHRRDRLDQAADRAVAIMQRALGTLETQLRAEPGAASALTPGALVVTVSAERIDVRPRGALLYAPVSPPAFDPPASTFVEGERLEFTAGDLAGAAATYARLAGSPDAAVRAGALLRGARVARRRGDHTAALRAYAGLKALDSTHVDELPAALAARLGRMTVFREVGRVPDLAAEASALLADLHRGRWLVTKAQYDAYTAEARAAATNTKADDAEAIAEADAVQWLWSNHGARESAGSQLLRLDAGPALVIWRSTAAVLTAVVAGQTFLAELGSEAFAGDVGWSLSALDGQTLLGDPPPAQPVAVRTANAAGLPWTVHVFPSPGQAPAASPRRPLLLLVLILVTLVLAAGWFFIFRSLARERQVAELQSDFVAAVSHEFRSPLTSISHIAELLAQDRLEPDALRRQSYGVLVRDTTRLRDLVEGLLDFARFDRGAPAFRFETVDLGDLIQRTVAEFQDRVAADGYRVGVTGGAEDISVSADRDAVGRALWNLLDNAVKYSPEAPDIRVHVAVEGGAVSIAVRDQGLGIPADEQRRIFERFVRGGESKRRRIRGTGIGLAMVRQIVLAHGGTVSVASEPGAGSCFTIVLPVSAERGVPAERPSGRSDPARASEPRAGRGATGASRVRA